MTQSYLIQNARMIDAPTTSLQTVRIAAGKIIDRGPDLRPAEGETQLDLKGAWLAPGLVDVHTHGGNGIDVNAMEIDDVSALARFHASQGTTAFLCSILTDTEEQTMKAIKAIRAARERQIQGLEGTEQEAEILGIHLEGPFLAPAYKGAMPECLLKEGDIELVRRYQDAAAGLIRYITVSPEIQGVIEMIPALRAMGIVVSIGHSGADYETAMRAIDHGATSSTHTGNAMRLLHQHEPAIWGAVLERDEVYCEAICDGRHLHPGTVRLYLKCKGPQRLVAVTDCIMAAGLPDGQYKLGVNDVTVKDGDARLTTTNVRAGSTLTNRQAIRNLMTFTRRGIPTVVGLLSTNPARMLSLTNKGDLKPGCDADLLAVDEQGEILHIWVRGHLIAD